MTSHRPHIPAGILFLVMLLGSVALFLLPARWTGVLREGFHDGFAPLLRIGRATDAPAIRMGNPGAPMVSPAEYNKLYTAYKNTYAQLLDMQDRLTKLQGIRAGLPTAGSALILAKVANTLFSAEEQGLLVSPVSRKEYIAPGQYVIGQGSVIGSVCQVYSSTAQVRLVTDSKHKMLVAVGRAGRNGYLRAQMQGCGNGTGRIVNLSRQEHDVRPGDTVYAAARAGFLGTEVVIGEVVEVQADRDKPLLWDIRVRPVCQAETLTEVAIVVMESGPLTAGHSTAGSGG